jgi:hypothetical protein
MNDEPEPFQHRYRLKNQFDAPTHFFKLSSTAQESTIGSIDDLLLEQAPGMMEV